jgi:hypothetical protein
MEKQSPCLSENVIRSIIDAAKEDNTNLLEFYIINNYSNSSENVDVFDTSLSKEVFYKMMHTCQKKYTKCQLQQFKCSVLGDIHYCNHENKDINVFSKRTTAVYKVSSNILYIGNNKKKLTIMSFPSTQTYDHEEYVKTLTYKISNRLSIILSQSKTKSSTPTLHYLIKLTYSHDENVDKDMSIKMLHKHLVELDAC